MSLLEQLRSLRADQDREPPPLVRDFSFDQARQRFIENTAPWSVEAAAEAGSARIFEVVVEHQLAGYGDCTVEKLWPRVPRPYRRYPFRATSKWRVQGGGGRRYFELDSVQDGLSLEDWKSQLLHNAIRDAKFSVLQRLIELGADVNSCMGCPVRMTPLHTATFIKDARFTKELLRNGADLARPDSKGHTPLHQAVSNGYLDVTAALLEWEADPNARVTGESRPFRRTALMMACGLRSNLEKDLAERAGIVEMLIKNYADVWMRDTDGKLWLQYGVETEDPEIVKQLLAVGVQACKKGSDGQTTLH